MVKNQNVRLFGVSNTRKGDVMNVSICSKRTIIADDYSELVIRYSTNKKYYVDARPDTKKYISNKLEMEFIDSIINLDDKSILTGLINHFFENVTLTKMLFNCPVQGKIGDYDLFGSDIDDKTLALQTVRSEISPAIKMKLRYKYYKDRENFLKQSNINRYSIKPSFEGSSYFVLGKRIYINLCADPVFIQKEICFLNEFIIKKLKEEQQVAIIYDDNIKYHEYDAEVCVGKIIKCGDLIMKISSEFTSNIDYIVHQHNKEIKVKQLKMEGF